MIGLETFFPGKSPGNFTGQMTELWRFVPTIHQSFFFFQENYCKFTQSSHTVSQTDKRLQNQADPYIRLKIYMSEVISEFQIILFDILLEIYS